MDRDIILGVVIVLVALGLSAYLVLWSRRRIDRIAKGQFRSARRTLKDLRGE